MALANPRNWWAAWYDGSGCAIGWCVTSKVGQAMGEGANRGGLSRRYIMAEIDRTLRRLQTDYLDVYFMHVPDPVTRRLKRACGRCTTW